VLIPDSFIVKMITVLIWNINTEGKIITNFGISTEFSSH
jgi:hypothetical protein